MNALDGSQPQAGPSSPHRQRDPSSGEAVARERLVYIPRERSCPLFSGIGEIKVRTWVEEVQAIMRARRLATIDKAHFIYDHLIGDAREEIKYRPQQVREDPNLIFEILLAQYSCPMSFIAVKEAFYARRQQEGESLREFSHAPFSLMDKMIQSCPEKRIPDAAKLLRDQFVECVGDGNLSRELRRIAREHPDCDLHAIRDEAIRWEREGRSGEELGRPRSYSVPSVYSMQHAGQARGQKDSVGSELAELKEMLKQQQAQIDKLTQGLRSHHMSVKPRSFQKGGPLICRRCQKPGHFAKDCDNERVVASELRCSTQSSVIQPSQFQQSEN